MQTVLDLLHNVRFLLDYLHASYCVDNPTWQFNSAPTKTTPTLNWLIYFYYPGDDSRDIWAHSI